MDNQQEVYFSIDSRLLFQLGEKLVADRAVALAELVKNSYDADATHVVIKMKKVKERGGTIEIMDNGSGIDQLRFNQAWMRIATIDKEKNPISAKYGRQKAGEKGIGRFACRRLSEILELESVATDEKGDMMALKAIFKWAEFSPGSDVNAVPVLSSVASVDPAVPTGTTLRLMQTTEPWTLSNIRQLKLELLDLMSPTTYRSEDDARAETYDPGFRIDFECPEFPVAVESLDKAFFRNAWAKLSASVDGEGHATYRIQNTEKAKNQLDKTLNKEEPFKYLRDVQMDAYLFSYRPDFFRNSDWKFKQAARIGEDRGGIKVYADSFRVFGYGSRGDDWLETDYDRGRSIETLSNEVAPYVDEDVRPGLSLFRTNNVFGHVVFSRASNPRLEITVNRERITSNESFEELRKFARLGIDFATVLYANQVFREQSDKRRRREALEAALAKAAQKAREQAESAKLEADRAAQRSIEEKRQIEEAVALADKEAADATQKREIAEASRREAEDKRRAIEEQMRTAGSTARWKDDLTLALKNEKKLLESEKAVREKEHLAVEFAKATRYRSGDLIEAATDVAIKAAEETRKAEEALKKAAEEELNLKHERLQKERTLLRVLASTGTLILIFGHELGALIDDMEDMLNTANAARSNTSASAQEDFQIVLDSFGNRTEMVKELGQFLDLVMGIESRAEKRDWAVYPLVEQVFRPFRWYLADRGITFSNVVPEDLRTPPMYRSELVSVLHNLMSNAVKAVSGQHVRRIEVAGLIAEGETRLQFLDTGRGLNKERWELVFEPFESDSEPDVKFGAGTGLGLKIVRDIVRSYDGDAQFIDPPASWATCVEITFPVEEVI